MYTWFRKEALFHDNSIICGRISICGLYEEFLPQANKDVGSETMETFYGLNEHSAENISTLCSCSTCICMHAAVSEYQSCMYSTFDSEGSVAYNTKYNALRLSSIQNNKEERISFSGCEQFVWKMLRV